MIIVSDTTPFRYLIEIEAVELLEKLFGQVIIPEKVFAELQGESTPEQVKKWIQSAPAWVEVRRADTSLYSPATEIQDGEREDIALALELKADALLIDDKDARREAKRTGLFIIPTLAVLEIAAKKGLVDLPEMIERLSKTTFHATRKLFDQILERDRKRRESKA
jgi:predicted nucleic acid-binding protein